MCLRSFWSYSCVSNLDRVIVDLRKASTASLSLIEGALTQDPRLRPNYSSHNLAHYEPEAMSCSMIEPTSAASGDGGSASPRIGRFSFFGGRGARKSSVKSKPQVSFMCCCLVPPVCPLCQSFKFTLISF